MAKKKAAEEPIEEVQAVVEETVVKEQPKAKKSRAKKTETPTEKIPVVEETPVEAAPVVEAAPAEEIPTVEEPKEEIKEEPVVEAQPVVEAKPSAESVPYYAKVKSSLLNIYKGASLAHVKVGELPKGFRVQVLEVQGNFGRIGNHKWININYIEKV